MWKRAAAPLQPAAAAAAPLALPHRPLQGLSTAAPPTAASHTNMLSTARRWHGVHAMYPALGSRSSADSLFGACDCDSSSKNMERRCSPAPCLRRVRRGDARATAAGPGHRHQCCGAADAGAPPRRCIRGKRCSCPARCLTPGSNSTLPARYRAAAAATTLRPTVRRPTVRLRGCSLFAPDVPWTQCLVTAI